MGEPHHTGLLRRHFYGGASGPWRVSRYVTCTGSGIAPVSHIAHDEPVGWTWLFTGTTSNLRYTSRDERQSLVAPFAGIAPAPATRAVLIPIRKSAEWWALAQDERLDIYRRGRHTPIGLEHLPRVRRTLFHCRDLGRDLGSPFDFLTWFEFDQAYDEGFRHLLDALRASEEWRYVDHEVELWLEPDARQAMP